MEAKGKVTKELVAQESRFILDCLENAAKFSPQVSHEELRRLCEQSVSLRLADYIGFLERFGYLTHDRATSTVGITPDGLRVVAGERIAELVIDVVHHFRPILSKPRREETAPVVAASLSPPLAPSSTSARSPLRAAKRSSTRDLIDDRYEKVRVIGSGGIGTVYLARQLQLDRNVALKEVRELFAFFTEPQRIEIGRRFEEEVRKASRLLHPNIAVVLDANTGRDQPYVVSEFITGGNLRRILKYADAIPPELSVKIFLQVLHALGHAHSKGVIHRGLKPENILFDATGNVRVTDFGVARAVERDEAVIQHVYVGMGAIGYMAPELFTDPGNVGTSSDLYSLGIILYEMLSRKLPGRRSPMPTQLHPTLPKVIDDLFDRLTQDERSDRYPSVDEVLSDFHKADASKVFLEPRGAVLFLESPLDKLQIKEPEGEKGWRESERTEASVPSPSTASDPCPASPTFDEREASRSLEHDLAFQVSESAGPASLSSVLLAGETREKASSDPIDAVEAVEVDGSEPLNAELIEDGEEGDGSDEGDRPKRRSGVYRPYSFQQRKKEREK